ncbi:hypothetical protein A3I27_00115 [Candidatus Giovannonibacteria bacterium RIFCSPLOWO2_02_FULL_43_11b]|uniref:Class I SAM-dependent methyltransferase n=1 Tax=Candidatus Giovannonibacteria bacterium RIFCSPHIGHO2_12_FULL_43_15 TaxID=1798341 RepID=A0A1F5WNR4_9BACT|nr:MAG: hypothetical protein A3F23_01180 [Candidatus Giovannonibacteria bacterium RIFCSPHIGHO2_12_FULL_43_15]OGF89388.1 MAG: hypothetical protein A3I27_00115 [Candidatus Giovannonibacteria bacterium RIFCSPLOWO2_02_FULL_43_11b]OGF91561.1 MAG: hypothetical protein A3H04_02750 [Candidatus Giovannonibacteria bacterium RIFCSPLOWO2_12_FULL_43_11c]
MFDFANYTNGVEGWLTEDEGLFLYEITKNVKEENAAVEIGSWKGKSTICIAKGLNDGRKGKVYAIDPHTGSPEHRNIFGKVDTFKEFEENISNKEVNSFVMAIRDTSENASKKFELPVEFIFIDGDHDLRAVAKDFESWFPKVIDGGTIAFHDSWNFIGPNILTACLLLFSPKVKNPGLINRITYFEKTEKNSMLDRFRNIKFLLHRTMFALKIFIYKNRKKLRKFIRNRI